MGEYPDRLHELGRDYLEAYFSTYPTEAAGLGRHEFDGRLPNLSPDAIAARLVALEHYEQQLTLLAEHDETPVAWLDRTLLAQAITHERFELDTLRDWESNPLAYNAALDVSGYIKRDYAPFDERMTGLAKHLEGVPDYLQQARANLVAEEAAAVVVEKAIEMFAGHPRFLKQALPLDRITDPALLEQLVQARDTAISAIEDFVDYLRDDLLLQATGDFAIGVDAYREMLRTGEAVDVPLDRLLALGKADLERNKARAEALAADIKPGASVREVLEEMEREHPEPEGLVDATRALLDDLRTWVIEHEVVTVPDEAELYVDTTPEYLRWAFAMLDSAGPFETHSREAYYYVTPPEPDWSSEETEQWMAKFDHYTLTDVSIHEAYPGHYLHTLHFYSSPSTLSQVFTAYSFWEAWAHYVEQMMIEQGYGGGDPKLHLAQVNAALVRNVRYVCAIHMHTQGMTVEEATTRFQNDAFMTRKTAEAEAVRGTFDPGYLNYTLGKLMLLKLREDVRRRSGSEFTLRAFHDRFLSWGSPPVPFVRRLMLGDADDGELLPAM